MDGHTVTGRRCGEDDGEDGEVVDCAKEIDKFPATCTFADRTRGRIGKVIWAR